LTGQVPLPAALRRRLAQPFGSEVVGATAVGGGCISDTARLVGVDGRLAFLKWDSGGGAPVGLFAAEARGLEALAATGAVRVPAVLAVADAEPGGGERGERWLLLEWLEPGRPTEHTWQRLGTDLARLHRHPAASFGAASDNFIGPLPQGNGWSTDWPSFWRGRRLAPQLRRARDAGYFAGAESRRFDRLLDRLPEHLSGAAAEGPSLLHGDLWNGNVQVLQDGTPALIDPSAYYGHREVDLAMTELFGGFGPAFHRAYRAEYPLVAGYESVRRPIYQLYYLLVHVNLFGGGYVPGTLAALRAVG
jgi:fructosamine-3-kinase